MMMIIKLLFLYGFFDIISATKYNYNTKIMKLVKGQETLLPALTVLDEIGLKITIAEPKSEFFINFTS